MKQIMTISAALLFLTIGEVQAQNGIEQVLKNIETNNKELQANEQLITSQKLEAKTDNNLPDPTLSYAHLWGAKVLAVLGTAARKCLAENGRYRCTATIPTFSPFATR